MPDVEVRAFRALQPDREGVDQHALPCGALVAGNDRVHPRRAGEPDVVGVGHRALRERHSPARGDVAAERVEVLIGLQEPCLGPRPAAVVGLRDPWVAALRAVEGDVHVATVIARDQDRLVVPADVAVGLDRRRPCLAVVGRADEDHVVAVHERCVDVAVVGNDFDLRVELAAALAGAQGHLRTPGRTAVLRDRERHPRCGAVALARLRDAVASRDDVGVRRIGIRRHRGLPVVGPAVDDVLAGPPGGGRGDQRRRVDSEGAVGSRLGRRFQPLVGGLRLLRRLGVAALSLLASGLALDGGSLRRRRFALIGLGR